MQPPGLFCMCAESMCQYSPRAVRTSRNACMWGYEQYRNTCAINRRNASLSSLPVIFVVAGPSQRGGVVRGIEGHSSPVSVLQIPLLLCLSCALPWLAVSVHTTPRTRTREATRCTCSYSSPRPQTHSAQHCQQRVCKSRVPWHFIRILRWLPVVYLGFTC